MDDLMARTMVENLALGMNPLTGEALPDGDICNNEVIQAALEKVLENCLLESYAVKQHKKPAQKGRKTYLVKTKDESSKGYREIRVVPAKECDEWIKSLCRQIQEENKNK